MMENPIYLALLFAVIGTVFIVLGIPLKQGAIPPNRFYGFRTRKTLSDREVWYAINRVTGIDMIRVGGLMVVVSLLLLAIRNWIGPDVMLFILLAVMVISVAYMAIHGISLLKRM